MAKGPNPTLREGDPAPGFSAETNGGSRVSLQDFNGKHITEEHVAEVLAAL